MLASYALWSVQAGLEDAVADPLAAIEAAQTVFGVAHQMHGAVGFYDETPLSWVSRHSQPLWRLPFGLSATRMSWPACRPDGTNRPLATCCAKLPHSGNGKPPASWLGQVTRLAGWSTGTRDRIGRPARTSTAHWHGLACSRAGTC